MRREEMMLEYLPSIIIGAVSLIIGYLFSWYRYRKFRNDAIKLLRPFEEISIKDEYYLTNILINKIKEKRYTPDLIIAIAPGGAMIGEWISRFISKINCPITMHCLWMNVQRDKEGKHTSPPIAEPCYNSSENYSNILIVNDISRTGRTLGEAIHICKEKFPQANIRTAVLFLSQEATDPYPNYYVDNPPRRIDFEWKRHHK
jgi:hypoxanthine phosphoribosyltransferase